MLRHAMFLILFLIFSVWLGILLQQDPGFALFAWRQTSVEMPLWFAVLCFLACLYLCWLLAHLFSVLPHSLYRLRQWRDARRQQRCIQKTADGLLALLNHRWQKAEQQLTSTPFIPSLQPVQYLGAAYAAERQQARKRRDAWMAHVQSLPTAQLLQADFAMSEGHPEKVIDLLEPHRSEPARLIRLQKALRRLEHWEALLALLPAVRKTGVLTPERAERAERKTARQWLAAESGDLARLQHVWHHLPRHLQRDARVVRTCVTSFMQHPSATETAAALLVTTLNRQYDPALVRLYGELALPDAKKQLHQAEKWLKYKTKQSALLLTLGRLAIRCRLWGKARDYLEDCLRRNKKEAAAHAALGWLEEQTGDPQLALAHYRESCRESLK